MCLDKPDAPQKTPIITRDDTQVLEAAEDQRRRIAMGTSFADTILTKPTGTRGPNVLRKELTGG